MVRRRYICLLRLCGFLRQLQGRWHSDGTHVILSVCARVCFDKVAFGWTFFDLSMADSNRKHIGLYIAIQLHAHQEEFLVFEVYQVLPPTTGELTTEAQRQKLTEQEKRQFEQARKELKALD